MFHLILKENNSYDKEIALNDSLNDKLEKKFRLVQEQSD